jgi:hypothetical protein
MEQPTQACPGQPDTPGSKKAAVEQLGKARLALGPVELVVLLHGQPRHPPTLGGQRVTGTGQLLLLHQQLLARGLPLLR